MKRKDTTEFFLGLATVVLLVAFVIAGLAQLARIVWAVM